MQIKTFASTLISRNNVNVQYHWRPVKLHSHKSKSISLSPGKENAPNGARRKRVKKDHNPSIEDVKVVQAEE